MIFCVVGNVQSWWRHEIEEGGTKMLMGWCTSTGQLQLKSQFLTDVDCHGRNCRSAGAWVP